MKVLFEKVDLGGLTVKNRFVRSATYEGFADESGHLTQKLFNFYEDIAAGGAGTIITGLTQVSNREKPLQSQMAIYDDSFILGYKKLREMVHRYEAKIIVQLVGLGSQTTVDENNSSVMFSPSGIEDLGSNTNPQEMDIEEILHIKQSFKNAAVRAKKASFDGIQIHAAHGYLISKFLTPYYNRRTDKYGGNLENRARLLFEIYSEIRESVGKDYPVFVKLNCDDFMDNGFSFDESKWVAKKLEELGVNAIELSGGSASSRQNEGVARNARHKTAYFIDYATELQKELSIPVISVGGHRDFSEITSILNEGVINYFSLSRPILCESSLINRWNDGDLSPSKCLSCNSCFKGGGTICILNKQKNKQLLN